ncbi:P-loop containing nucleoside triphosphate hydrolase protein [Hygrophoropsis aurantiaca]|uniref:P-loop containing nucleoside triphosphate hydrolase protein n=1 Tax=Hygrophoropsis aurantiaca TaxID=72124 RepID=A0ACB8A094_9AGAM|nr:P-loop containing nucleoside triphosphate hydrolase protein [Hygrophoropsis aurantiaca]
MRTNEHDRESAVGPFDSTSSIRSSLDLKETINVSSSQTLASPTTSTHDISSPAAPSMKLLFSFLTPRRKLVLLAPAMVSSMVAGGIAPFMTYVVGQSFNAFAAFPLTANPPQSAKDALLRGVGLAALELVALGVGALVMSSITSSLWIWTGEHNVEELRRRVYHAVTTKKMEWFDMRVGADGVQDTPSQTPVGAGGLMAKFARETDEVRAASSLAAGQLLQYLTTALTCLILAFTRSPLLTLVILSAVPALILIQGFSQGLAGPRLARERSLTAGAATLVERAVTAIATVKAFNAASHEATTLSALFHRVSAAAQSLARLWGATAALSQFVTMAMFVQGFWFGAHLVRQGKNSPGDVMSVFWACLIATSNLQMAIPLLVVLAKGKAAAAELAGIVSTTTTTTRRRTQELRKIHPQAFTGELTLASVSFAYPARADVPVLQAVDMYLPAHETTFIVGASGSGKSTLGAILMGHYAPSAGSVLLDEQDTRYLDGAYLARHVAGVAQGAAGTPVFGGSLHANVAVGVVGKGRRAEDVSRGEVEEACRVAMLESWVADLEHGYDTLLGGGIGAGEGGIQLSGGQRQRLAIARARVRDPDVLILDEATSALDPPTRALIMAAIRRWRRNRTTIVITHDLAPIEADDFVYVMKAGQVVEQGFRADLEDANDEFARMLRSGGAAPDEETQTQEDGEQLPEYEEMEMEEESEHAKQAERHFSVAPTLGGVRPVTMTLGNWMFDVVAELTKASAPPPTLPTTTIPASNKDKDWRVSRFVPAEAFSRTLDESEAGAAGRKRRPSSMSILIPELTFPPRAYGGQSQSRRLSLQFTPTSPAFPTATSTGAFSDNDQQPMVMVEDDEEFEEAKRVLKRSATQAAGKRGEKKERRQHVPAMQGVIVHSPQKSRRNATTTNNTTDESAPAESPAPGLFALLRAIYPTMPGKPLILLGLLVCLLSGAMTPIFSFLLSQLMFEVSAGASDASLINVYGALVLGIAALDGLLLGAKYFLMETSAMRWVTRLRDVAFARVMRQDKAWFDRGGEAARVTQVLVKDADDARALVAIVLGQCVVVSAMLGLGLLWAMAWGWQLTLVGLAVAPVFVGVMGVQTGLVAKCEVRNKRAREEVAKIYYESILNVRGIRAMSLEPVLQSQFDKAAARCLSTGVRGAFVEGCTYGVASALIYLAEALLFYVGAVLMAHGTYTYLQMVQTLNLVVFTVTIGSQLMAFTQKIAKSVQATADLNALVHLETENTHEAQGMLRPQIAGDLVFNGVSFAYPTNPDVPVLKNLSMKIADGECVAIVGGSGCGKSTIAALLQRLYEPDVGTIAVGLNDLRATDVTHLREHVAVVSQNPHLFDASIRENIAYGRAEGVDVVCAAQAAHVHDFVMGLPQGYDTLVGENASLISGGQAQRLQIARALARPAKILILDECTSALDPANQSAVLDTIREAKVGRTTIMVTHKVPVMRMCDRILVVEDGAVCEQGTYEALMERKGVFAKLANGGEWVGE